jgi:hypothetical protein
MASFTFAVPNIVFGQGKAAEMYVLLEGVGPGRFDWNFGSFFQKILIEMCVESSANNLYSRSPALVKTYGCKKPFVVTGSAKRIESILAGLPRT